MIIGCFVGALVIAPVLEILYHAYGFTGALPRPDMDPAQALSAPQATLMTTISQGIFTDHLELANEPTTFSPARASAPDCRSQ